MLAALVAVLAATLFTIPSSAGAAPKPSASGTGSAAVPRLDWAACAGEGLQAFECATAVVPLDYDRPKGTQITLALTRLPAGDPSRRIGSLFISPGGPGGWRAQASTLRAVPSFGASSASSAAAWPAGRSRVS